MGLTDTVFGNPGTTVIQQTNPTKPPGYGFASQLFNYLGSLAGTPYPSFSGSLDPGLSPTMQDAIRRSQGYAATQPSEILQASQGVLGRFMAPSFANPQARMFGGAPDYAGVDPNQRIWGGQPAGSYTFQSGMPSFQNASMPQGQGQPWQGQSGIGQFLQMLMQQLGGQQQPQAGPQQPPAQPATPTQPDTRPAWMQLRDRGIGGQGSVAANRAALAGMPAPQQPPASTPPTGLRNFAMPQTVVNNPIGTGPLSNFSMSGAMPYPGPSGGIWGGYPPTGGAQPQMAASGAPPSGPFPTPTPTGKPGYGLAPGTFEGSVPGAQKAWSMGNMSNYGMTRDGAGGREVYVGGGGGESGQWVPYDERFHKDIATLHSRYGSDWSSGSKAGGGHSGDIAGHFQNAFGRAPSLEEKYDWFYGTPGHDPKSITPTSADWKYQGPPR